MVMTESPKSLKDIPPWQGMLIGVLFGGVGVFILLLSFGVLDPEGGMNAPAEIGALAGAVFLMPGLLSVYYAIRNFRRIRNKAAVEEDFDIASWLVTSLILSAFALIGLWISLAGRSEAFSGGVPGSVSAARIAFGVGAIICAAAAALYWSHGFTKLLRKKKDRPS
jgi:uncharacterized membrane protein YidH (DUF202 family)